MSGRVVHFEVPVDDVDRASDFYREAFGWQMNSPPELNYTLVLTTPTGDDGAPKDPGGINGGMLKRLPGFTGPVITIEVDDIDAAFQRVEQLGGKSFGLGRFAVGDMGFAGYFTDTEGNVIGLWESAPQT